MAQSPRTGTTSAARIPQLLVMITAGLVVLTGLWLWFVGEDIGSRTGIEAESFELQRLIIRVHWIAAFALAAVVLFMLLEAASGAQAWRSLLLTLLLVFVGIGFWAGYTADWQAARLWSETVGTKLSAGISLGDNRPALPSTLREARVHLSVVPAALLIVAIASLLHSRRS